MEHRIGTLICPLFYDVIRADDMNSLNNVHTCGYTVSSNF